MGPVEVPCEDAQDQGGLLKRLLGVESQGENWDSTKSLPLAPLQSETLIPSLQSNVRTIR